MKRFVMLVVLFVGTSIFFISEIGAQEKTYNIGDRGPAGGWIFYDKGNKSDGWRYLEAAPEDQAKSISWASTKDRKATPVAKGTAVGTGKSNTAAILKSPPHLKKYPAKIATEYRGGGKSDWFLPSLDELKLMYDNLQDAGVCVFRKEQYWSSSQMDESAVYYVNFRNGGKNYTDSVGHLHVRAIRQF